LPFGQTFEGCVSDGTITCAAAEIATQLVVDLPRRLEISAMVRLEQRHDKPRRTVTALRSMPINHRLLDRMQLIRGGDTLD
jgi:hypothetical protein